MIVLTQPKGYVKKKASPLIKLALRKYPKIAEGMACRHEIYNRQIKMIEEREKEGRVFVIRPPEPLGVGKTEKNPEKLEKAYQAGRKEAQKILPELRGFLNT